MLSVDDLANLLVAEGEEIEKVSLDELKAGEIIRIRNTTGWVYFFQVTVPISRRANVYKFDGKNFEFRDSFHIPETIKQYGIVQLNNNDTGIITSLTLIHRH